MSKGKECDLFENAKKQMRKIKVKEVPSFNNDLIRNVNDKTPLLNIKTTHDDLQYDFNGNAFLNNSNNANDYDLSKQFNVTGIRTFYRNRNVFSKEKLVKHPTPYQKIKLKQSMQKAVVEKLRHQNSNHFLPVTLKPMMMIKSFTNEENSKKTMFTPRNAFLKNQPPLLPSSNQPYHYYQINAATGAYKNEHYTSLKRDKKKSNLARINSSKQIGSKLTQYQSISNKGRFINGHVNGNSNSHNNNNSTSVLNNSDSNNNSNNASLIAESLIILKHSKSTATYRPLKLVNKSTAVNTAFSSLSLQGNKIYSTCHSYKFLHKPHNSTPISNTNIM